MTYNLRIPGQFTERELWAIEEVAKLVPPGGVVVEVGSSLGMSSYVWAKNVHPSVTVYCIDVWENDPEYAQQLGEKYQTDYTVENFRSFTEKCPNIVTLPGFSPQDFAEWDKSIDVYCQNIDGPKMMIEEDINFWSQFVKPGGIICGFGYSKKFPDVVARVGKLDQVYQVKPVIVGSIWCLPVDGNVGKLKKVAGINGIHGYQYQFQFNEYPKLVNPGDLLRISGKLQNCSGRDWQIYVDDTEIIKIGVKVYEGDQKERKSEPRESLRIDKLTDGVTVKFDFVLDTREVSQDKIRLEFDLVSEGWYWFKNKGAKPETLEVNVLPRTAGNLIKVGSQLKREGKLYAAVAEYRRAIELNPHFSWSHYNLADALAKQGHLEEAVAEYRKAIKLNPNSILSHAALAKALYKKLCFSSSVSLPFSGFENVLFKESYDKSEMILSYNKIVKTRSEFSHPNLTEEELLGFFKKSIIVAGIPRSGTTMMFRALAGLEPGDTTPRNYCGPVKKTHGLAPKKLPEGYKVIFIFGDVINSVISTKKFRYDKTHFINCGCTKDPEATDIYLEDALNYEAMFDSWNQDNGYPVICVRYETIYENLKQINNFFIFTNLSLPSKKQRTTRYFDCNKEELNNIKKTYRNLIEKVNNAPDIARYC
jgi:tetratricopeptide (TPR) repeat protein